MNGVMHTTQRQPSLLKGESNMNGVMHTTQWQPSLLKGASKINGVMYTALVAMADGMILLVLEFSDPALPVPCFFTYLSSDDGFQLEKNVLLLNTTNQVNATCHLFHEIFFISFYFRILELCYFCFEK